MRWHKRNFGAVLAFGLAWITINPAGATTLYDNGPINGTVNGYALEGGFAVSNSFTLTQNSVLTGVTFGAWTWTPAGPLTAVDWGITATAATYPISGTASVTTGAALSPASSYGFGGLYTVSLDSFSLPNISLAAGAYYLVLQNAVGGYALWDMNFGSSAATQGVPALSTSRSIRSSESFQIIGEVATTPLPATLPLFVSGAGLLSYLGWRRKKKSGSTHCQGALR